MRNRRGFCFLPVLGVWMQLAVWQTAFAGRPPQVVAPAQPPITIVAVGDLMLGSTFPDASRLPPDGGAHLLAPFAAVLHSGDITFGNLEGPLLDGGTSTKCGSQPADGLWNCYAFRVPPAYGVWLKDAGFSVLSVANNHAGDFGAEGRASTLDVLEKQSILAIGAGRDRLATAILTVRGRRVGWIGFAFNNVSPDINDLPEARRLIAELRSRVDVLIVSFHNGAEGAAYQHVSCRPEIFHGEARGNPCAFAHMAVDAGADLVLGHGPHVLRGMELYKGRLIVYSMGNFCTYGWFHLAGVTALTAVFRITLSPDGRFLSGHIYPGQQVSPGGPTPDPDGRAIEVIRALSQADFGAASPVIERNGMFREPKTAPKPEP